MLEITVSSNTEVVLPSPSTTTRQLSILRCRHHQFTTVAGMVVRMVVPTTISKARPAQTGGVTRGTRARDVDSRQRTSCLFMVLLFSWASCFCKWHSRVCMRSCTLSMAGSHMIAVVLSGLDTSSVKPWVFYHILRLAGCLHVGSLVYYRYR